MPIRSASVAILAAVALVLTPVGASVGAESTGNPKVGKSDAAKARHHAKKAEARRHARKLENRINSHRSFVLGGTVADDAVGSDPAGTLTFIVHGHRYKALRGLTVTVAVDPAAKITRGDASATLADVVTGDHVVVKSHSVDVVASVVGRGAGAVTSFTLTMTVHRVAASPAEVEVPAA